MSKEKEIKSHTIVLMICTALFFDVLQWVLAFVFMDWLVSIFAYLTFFLWFKINGVSFTKPKRLATAGSTILLESFPIIASLPALTAGVVITALDTKVKKLAPN